MSNTEPLQSEPEVVEDASSDNTPQLTPEMFSKFQQEMKGMDMNKMSGILHALPGAFTPEVLSKMTASFSEIGKELETDSEFKSVVADIGRIANFDTTENAKPPTTSDIMLGTIQALGKIDSGQLNTLTNSVQKIMQNKGAKKELMGLQAMFNPAMLQEMQKNVRLEQMRARVKTRNEKKNRR